MPPPLSLSLSALSTSPSNSPSRLIPPPISNKLGTCRSHKPLLRQYTFDFHLINSTSYLLCVSYSPPHSLSNLISTYFFLLPSIMCLLFPYLYLLQCIITLSLFHPPSLSNLTLYLPISLYNLLLCVSYLIPLYLLHCIITLSLSLFQPPSLSHRGILKSHLCKIYYCQTFR